MKELSSRLFALRFLLAAIVFAYLSACVTQGDIGESQGDTVVISVVGTNDVHGALLPAPFKGGLATLSAYVGALRAARAEDGGAVLLVDAGDMWQGTLESNLTEGAAVVDAFNELGYAAAAIGNHEFDFGPVGELAIPEDEADDPRGALKKNAMQANFPLLAANLIDESTNAPVDWPNVQPSTMVDVAGIKVGIVGVVTTNALVTTISANTVGLKIGSLSEAIVREADALRANGARLVVVVSHAGGRCDEFDDPLDLSSCDMKGEVSAEIMHVANALPAGLVDHIVAGHVHQGVAHVVNGIAITSSYASTFAFSRVDFVMDRETSSVVSRRVFPPQRLCSIVFRYSRECAWEAADRQTVRAATYEGRNTNPDPAVSAIVDRAAAHAATIKNQSLGVFLETPFTLEGNPESPLANLVIDAVYESIDADVVFHNVSGGIRATLPSGELTYGNVFSIFPFDNRIAIVEMSGADLRRIIAEQARKNRRRAGFAGMRVFVDCIDDRMSITMRLRDGREIQDNDRVRVGSNDFLTTGGDDILTPAMPDGGFSYPDDPRLVRSVIADWLRQRGGTLHADEFRSGEARRWNLPNPLPATCRL